MSDILYKIASYAAFLPILIALFHYKYLNKSLWWYLAGLMSYSLCSIVSIKLSEQHINNHFMIYVSGCSIMVFRTFFFYTFIGKNIYQKAAIFSSIAYLLWVCIDIYLHGIYMNQYLAIVADVWIIFFLLISLNQILQDEYIESLRSLPIFWVIVGTLIFVVFDFFLAVSNGWLYAVNRAFFFMIWDYITPFFIFIRIVFVSIGYWKTKFYAENLINR